MARSRLVIVALVVTGIILAGIYLLIPKRSIKAFCATYISETEKISSRWTKQQKKYDKSDSLTSLFGNMSIVAEAPGEAANVFAKLARVAPKEIEDDVVTLRDAFKEASKSDITTNPLQAIGSGLMLGFKTSGAQQRLTDYLNKNCDLSTYMKTAVSVEPTATPTPPILTTDGVPENSLKLWESPKSGIIAVLKDELVLIDPGTLKITARQKLPSPTGRTPGGDTGRSYSLLTLSNIRASYFDENYRYVPVVYKRVSDGSVLGRSDWGIYDIASDTVTDTVVQYNGSGGPVYLGIDRKKILFEKGNDNWFTYNIETKEVAEYHGPIQGETWDHNSAYRTVEQEGYVWDKTGKNIFKLGADKVDYYLGCEPVQMTTDKELLCVDKDWSQLYTIDVTNIIENKSSTDDPSSYSYRPGKLHYELPKPVPLLPEGSRYILKMVVSPDARTVIFEAAQGKAATFLSANAPTGTKSIYKLSLTDKKLDKMADMEAPQFLEWR